MNRKRTTLIIFTLFATMCVIGCRKQQIELHSDSDIGISVNQTDSTATTSPEVSISPTEIQLSPEEVREAELNKALETIFIPNADNIRGNISLTESVDTNDTSLAVTWSSNDENVITTTATGDNAQIPAGVVTRGEQDTKVVLAATIESEGAKVTKEFPLTVKAKAEVKEFGAYLYCYFQGDIYGKGQTQQIFLATSTDGLRWKSLNENQPVLLATLGTKGVRDPYLVRSKEGDKFYIIATDLDANGGDWGAYSTRGSRCIAVWESEDLVNWSEQRLIDIAPRNAECMWAPEAYYDDTTGEYVVYWSSGIRGGNGKKIYYTKTRDFFTFTKPQVFKDVERNADNIKNSGTGKIEANLTFIDTTLLEYQGIYYRFTKREIDCTILMETSDNILGSYSLVKNIIAGEKGVEGPSIFQLNGQEKWVLMMDGYTGKGYFPLIADSLEDLKSGRFVRLPGIQYQMPQGARHGSFLAITTEEYDALTAQWGN